MADKTNVTLNIDSASVKASADTVTFGGMYRGVPYEASLSGVRDTVWACGMLASFCYLKVASLSEVKLFGIWHGVVASTNIFVKFAPQTKDISE